MSKYVFLSDMRSAEGKTVSKIVRHRDSLVFIMFTDYSFLILDGYDDDTSIGVASAFHPAWYPMSLLVELFDGLTIDGFRSEIEENDRQYRLKVERSEREELERLKAKYEGSE